MTRRYASFLIAIVGLAVMAQASTAASSAASGWAHVAATRNDGGSSVKVELWYRGTEAVSIQTANGELVQEDRCEGGRLSSQGAGSLTIVTREGLTSERCFALATTSLLGFEVAVSAYGMAASSSVKGGYVATAEDSPWKLIALDLASGLPLRAVSADGVTLTWDYMNVGSDAGPPAFKPAPNATFERYVELVPKDSAKTFGVAALPPTIADLSLKSVFSYDADTAAGIAYYAIWANTDGSQVQLHLGKEPVAETGVSAAEPPGALQFTYNSELGAFRIYATDEALFQEAMAVLAPEQAP